MDFNDFLSDLRIAGQEFSEKISDKYAATMAYCETACKGLDRLERDAGPYENQVIGLWVFLGYIQQTYPKLTSGPAITALCQKIFRHCARTVLNIQWQQLDEKSPSRQNFEVTLQNLNQCLSASGYTRFSLILQLMDSGWTRPILSQVMAGEEDNEDGEGLNYIINEDPVILKIRVEMMLQENCEEFALNLCSWCLKHPALKDDLDIRQTQLMLFHKLNNSDRLQEECQKIPCHDGVRLISRMRQMEKYKSLCTRLAQIFLVQDWINQSEHCCTKDLLKLWIRHQYLADRDKEKFLKSVWAIAKLSSATDQILLMIDALKLECGDMFLQLYTDLCIFAINFDKSCLEKHMQDGDMEGLRSRQQAMACTCEKLATIYLKNDTKIARYSAVTSFALNPSTETLSFVEKFYFNMTTPYVIDRGKQTHEAEKCCTNCFRGEGACQYKKSEGIQSDANVDVATLLEVERLLNMLRPFYLNPDVQWTELKPLCQRFLHERERLAQKFAMENCETSDVTEPVPSSSVSHPSTAPPASALIQAANTPHIQQNKQPNQGLLIKTEKAAVRVPQNIALSASSKLVQHQVSKTLPTATQHFTQQGTKISQQNFQQHANRPTATQQAVQQTVTRDMYGSPNTVTTQQNMASVQQDTNSLVGIEPSVVLSEEKHMMIRNLLFTNEDISMADFPDADALVELLQQALPGGGTELPETLQDITMDSTSIVPSANIVHESAVDQVKQVAHNNSNLVYSSPTAARTMQTSLHNISHQNINVTNYAHSLNVMQSQMLSNVSNVPSTSMSSQNLANSTVDVAALVNQQPVVEMTGQSLKQPVSQSLSYLTIVTQPGVVNANVSPQNVLMSRSNIPIQPRVIQSRVLRPGVAGVIQQGIGAGQHPVQAVVTTNLQNDSSQLKGANRMTAVGSQIKSKDTSVQSLHLAKLPGKPVVTPKSYPNVSSTTKHSEKTVAQKCEQNQQCVSSFAQNSLKNLLHLQSLAATKAGDTQLLGQTDFSGSSQKSTSMDMNLVNTAQKTVKQDENFTLTQGLVQNVLTGGTVQVIQSPSSLVLTTPPVTSILQTPTVVTSQTPTVVYTTAASSMHQSLPNVTTFGQPVSSTELNQQTQQGTTDIANVIALLNLQAQAFPQQLQASSSTTAPSGSKSSGTKSLKKVFTEFQKNRKRTAHSYTVKSSGVKEQIKVTSSSSTEANSGSQQKLSTSSQKPQDQTLSMHLHGIPAQFAPPPSASVLERTVTSANEHSHSIVSVPGLTNIQQKTNPVTTATAAVFQQLPHNQTTLIQQSQQIQHIVGNVQQPIRIVPSTDQNSLVHQGQTIFIPAAAGQQNTTTLFQPATVGQLTFVQQVPNQTLLTQSGILQAGIQIANVGQLSVTRESNIKQNKTLSVSKNVNEVSKSNISNVKQSCSGDVAQTSSSAVSKAHVPFMLASRLCSSSSKKYNMSSSQSSKSNQSSSKSKSHSSLKDLPMSSKSPDLTSFQSSSKSSEVSNQLERFLLSSVLPKQTDTLPSQLHFQHVTQSTEPSHIQITLPSLTTAFSSETYIQSLSQKAETTGFADCLGINNSNDGSQVPMSFTQQYSESTLPNSSSVTQNSLSNALQVLSSKNVKESENYSDNFYSQNETASQNLQNADFTTVDEPYLIETMTPAEMAASQAYEASSEVSNMGLHTSPSKSDAAAEDSKSDVQKKRIVSKRLFTTKFKCMICSQVFEKMDDLRDHVRNPCSPGIETSAEKMKRINACEETLKRPSPYSSKSTSDKVPQVTKKSLEASRVYECPVCKVLCKTDEEVLHHRFDCLKSKSRPRNKKPKVSTTDTITTAEFSQKTEQTSPVISVASSVGSLQDTSLTLGQMSLSASSSSPYSSQAVISPVTAVLSSPLATPVVSPVISPQLRPSGVSVSGMKTVVSQKPVKPRRVPHTGLLGTRPKPPPKPMTPERIADLLLVWRTVEWVRAALGVAAPSFRIKALDLARSNSTPATDSPDSQLVEALDIDKSVVPKIKEYNEKQKKLKNKKKRKSPKADSSLESIASLKSGTKSHPKDKNPSKKKKEATQSVSAEVSTKENISKKAETPIDSHQSNPVKKKKPKKKPEPKYHVLEHLGRKYYKCDLCGQTFCNLDFMVSEHWEKCLSQNQKQRKTKPGSFGDKKIQKTRTNKELNIKEDKMKSKTGETSQSADTEKNQATVLPAQESEKNDKLPSVQNIVNKDKSESGQAVTQNAITKQDVSPHIDFAALLKETFSNAVGRKTTSPVISLDNESQSQSPVIDNSEQEKVMEQPLTAPAHNYDRDFERIHQSNEQSSQISENYSIPSFNEVLSTVNRGKNLGLGSINDNNLVSTKSELTLPSMSNLEAFTSNQQHKMSLSMNTESNDTEQSVNVSSSQNHLIPHSQFLEHDIRLPHISLPESNENFTETTMSKGSDDVQLPERNDTADIVLPEDEALGHIHPSSAADDERSDSLVDTNKEQEHDNSVFESSESYFVAGQPDSKIDTSDDTNAEVHETEDVVNAETTDEMEVSVKQDSAEIKTEDDASADIYSVLPTCEKDSVDDIKKNLDDDSSLHQTEDNIKDVANDEQELAENKENLDEHIKDSACENDVSVESATDKIEIGEKRPVLERDAKNINNDNGLKSNQSDDVNFGSEVTCDACGAVFGHVRTMIQHMVSRHLHPQKWTSSSISSIVCPFCNLNFSSYMFYMNHLPEHTTVILEKMRFRLLSGEKKAELLTEDKGESADVLITDENKQEESVSALTNEPQKHSTDSAPVVQDKIPEVTVPRKRGRPKKIKKCFPKKLKRENDSNEAISTPKPLSLDHNTTTEQSLDNKDTAQESAESDVPIPVRTTRSKTLQSLLTEDKQNISGIKLTRSRKQSQSPASKLQCPTKKLSPDKFKMQENVSSKENRQKSGILVKEVKSLVVSSSPGKKRQSDQQLRTNRMRKNLLKTAKAHIKKAAFTSNSSPENQLSCKQKNGKRKYVKKTQKQAEDRSRKSYSLRNTSHLYIKSRQNMNCHSNKKNCEIKPSNESSQPNTNSHRKESKMKMAENDDRKLTEYNTEEALESPSDASSPVCTKKLRNQFVKRYDEATISFNKKENSWQAYDRVLKKWKFLSSKHFIGKGKLKKVTAQVTNEHERNISQKEVQEIKLESCCKSKTEVEAVKAETKLTDENKEDKCVDHEVENSSATKPPSFQDSYRSDVHNTSSAEAELQGASSQEQTPPKKEMKGVKSLRSVGRSKSFTWDEEDHKKTFCETQNRHLHSSLGDNISAVQKPLEEMHIKHGPGMNDVKDSGFVKESKKIAKNCENNFISAEQKDEAQSMNDSLKCPVENQSAQKTSELEDVNKEYENNAAKQSGNILPEKASDSNLMQTIVRQPESLKMMCANVQKQQHGLKSEVDLIRGIKASGLNVGKADPESPEVPSEKEQGQSKSGSDQAKQAQSDTEEEEDETKTERLQRSLKSLREKAKVAPFTWDVDEDEKPISKASHTYVSEKLRDESWNSVKTRAVSVGTSPPHMKTKFKQDANDLKSLVIRKVTRSCGSESLNLYRIGHNLSSSTYRNTGKSDIKSADTDRKLKPAKHLLRKSFSGDQSYKTRSTDQRTLDLGEYLKTQAMSSDASRKRRLSKSEDGPEKKHIGTSVPPNEDNRVSEQRNSPAKYNSSKRQQTFSGAGPLPAVVRRNSHRLTSPVNPKSSVSNVQFFRVAPSEESQGDHSRNSRNVKSIEERTRHTLVMGEHLPSGPQLRNTGQKKIDQKWVIDKRKHKKASFPYAFTRICNQRK